MRICIFFLAVLLSLSLLSQDHGGFNYQAVVRDASNNIITNQPIGIQISLLQGSVDGPSIYRETFKPVSNNYGLINLQIGTGEVVSGSFSAIDWSEGPYFLETAMDINGGNNFAVMGTTRLRSVPYALHAGVADRLIEKTYSVGDKALGGVVFYINEEGTHGLVASTADQQDGVSWFEANDNLNNPESHDLSGSHYFDWRLPTRYELNLMYQRKSVIGNFTRDFYWSSIENATNEAWGQDFENGQQTFQNKSETGTSRLIRSF